MQLSSSEFLGPTSHLKNCCISAPVRPISTKFGVMMQNMSQVCHPLKIVLKIQDGGRPILVQQIRYLGALKSFYSHYFIGLYQHTCPSHANVCMKTAGINLQDTSPVKFHTECILWNFHVNWQNGVALYSVIVFVQTE